MPEQPNTRRGRVEAMRKREQAKQRRRTSALVAVGTAVAIVIVFVIVGATTKSTPKAAATSPANASVVAALAAVPESVINTVGAGSGVTGPTSTSGAKLTSDGKPRVAYVGAEYCPYCAAERWALAQALSRFGTFSGLGTTTSSSTDVYPSTATLDFHGSTYTSPYLVFTPYEEEDGSAQPLDTVPADIAALHTTIGGGTYPFVDLGGTAYIKGASYDPALLKGLTQAQIAQALSDPSSPVAKAVIAVANRITAQLCTLTGNQPANVCSASGVTAAASATS
ncbi:MAG TPA: DUF929 family protein [Mycobacteriales bacterium]|nr:DUF929 family protein [Mycobacteriales bacterium]